MSLWLLGYGVIVWRWKNSNVQSNNVNYWWKPQGKEGYESMNCSPWYHGIKIKTTLIRYSVQPEISTFFFSIFSLWPHKPLWTKCRSPFLKRFMRKKANKTKSYADKTKSYFASVGLKMGLDHDPKICTSTVVVELSWHLQIDHSCLIKWSLNFHWHNYCIDMPNVILYPMAKQW